MRSVELFAKECLLIFDKPARTPALCPHTAARLVTLALIIAGFAARAQTTNTTNPAAIRLGALVGTFAANPSRADWFLIGPDTTGGRDSVGIGIRAGYLQ